MEPVISPVADQDGHFFDLTRIACPSCKIRSFRVLGIRGGQNAHRYGLGVQTEIVQCRHCGLLFPDPFPIPQNHNELS